MKYIPVLYSIHWALGVFRFGRVLVIITILSHFYGRGRPRPYILLMLFYLDVAGLLRRIEHYAPQTAVRIDI